jgi:CO dehydrogenase maturation factor
MRVAFVAKGGSGKTTISSLFIRYALSKNKNVTAIDGDMNQHLSEALGLSDKAHKIKDLGNNMVRLREILASQNAFVENIDQMIESTPAAKGSHLVVTHKPSPIWDEFSYRQDNLRFLTAGAFKNENMAETCYHTYTGAVTMLLNHFIDTKDELVVVDMTAGSDPYTSGMFSRFDAVILVLEPTLKSVAVYDQCMQYGKEFSIPLYVVANKIEDESDLTFIREKVSDHLIAHLSSSAFVRKQERGVFQDINLLESENLDALEIILKQVMNAPKDWNKYQDLGENFHRIKAESWGNIFCGGDLMKQIDSNFSYQESAKSLGAS